MASRRRKRKPKRDPHDILGAAPGKGWDPTIQHGSLVFLQGESAPHIYEVVEFHRRLLMAQDLYNSPRLLSQGFKEGDEIPPYIVLRRKFSSPFYEETPHTKVYVRKTDGSKVRHITEDVVAELLSNLNSVLEIVKEEDNGI